MPRLTLDTAAPHFESASHRSVKRTGTRENALSDERRDKRHGVPRGGKIGKSFRFMVSRAGLEPATTALKVRCSTN